MPTEQASDNLTNIMAQAMRKSIPELRTQVQFTAFMAGFDAFRFMCNSIFGSHSSLEEQAKEALDKSFEAMRVATKLSNQFQEIPAEDRSPSSNQFIENPLQFSEYDTQKKLLSDLNQVTSTIGLNEWYQRTKDDREKVISQSLRNILFDAIRCKRDDLSKLQR
jgi:hypothetical protein